MAHQYNIPEDGEVCNSCCYNDGHGHEADAKSHSEIAYFRRGTRYDRLQGWVPSNDYTCLCNNHKKECDKISVEYHEAHRRISDDVANGGVAITQKYQRLIQLIDQLTLQSTYMDVSTIERLKEEFKKILSDVEADYFGRRRWRNRCTSVNPNCRYNNRGHQHYYEGVKQLYNSVNAQMQDINNQFDAKQHIHQTIKENQLLNIQRIRAANAPAVAANAAAAAAAANDAKEEEESMTEFKTKIKAISKKEFTTAEKSTITRTFNKMIKELNLPDKLTQIANFQFRKLVIDEINTNGTRRLRQLLNYLSSRGVFSFATVRKSKKSVRKSRKSVRKSKKSVRKTKKSVRK